MTTPIIGSETSINIPNSETEHSNVQGRRWTSNGILRDSTLTAVQKNFLKGMILMSLLGGACFVGLMVIGGSSSGTYSVAISATGLSGLIMCCVVTLFAAPLTQVFRDLNQRQNVTADTESSPLLAEV